MGREASGAPRSAQATTSGDDAQAVATREWFRRRIDADPLSQPLDAGPRTRAGGGLGLVFPTGWAPVVQEVSPRPEPGAPLPRADALVLVWTVAEARALADVLTPGAPAAGWYPYDRFFDSYLPEIRAGAPARVKGRLGAYRVTRVGSRRVLYFKSELHLNQDAVRRDGHATLPVARLVHQLLDEATPRVTVTTGTAGGTVRGHGLGDVVITRGAAFRLAQEFADEPFAQASYRSSFRVPRTQLARAEQMMQGLAGHLDEPAFGAPADGYDLPGIGDGVVPGPTHQPRIRVDGSGQIPRYHPILSADWFLFGSTTNGLGEQGVGVEMGDAVLGLVDEQRASSGRAHPPWVVVRNLSNPPINGNLPREPADMQAFWSGWYYETFGYWTSVNSALAVWALLAG